MRKRDPNERGAVLVVSCALMIALLALAAIAVDLGNARQHRRQAQNAADAAALAAANDLPDLTAAIATAKLYSTTNGEVPASAWTGCVDADHLHLTPDVEDNANECISFSEDLLRVRVRLPIEAVSTYFGGFVGRSSVEVTASAVAGAMVGDLVRIVPAAVTGVAGTGLVCIEQSGNDQPCATRERGQFGSLSSPRLHFFQPSSNVEQTSLAINYAMSLDHAVEPFDGVTAVCDGSLVSPCSASNTTSSSDANHVLAATGNSVPPVTEGYVTGFKAATTDEGTIGFCGRLQRPDYTASNVLDPQPDNCTAPGTPTTTILGVTVNGRHIYHWMTAEARQLFYPEVVAMGSPDTSEKFAVDGPVFGPGGVGNVGDDRLDCFLAGYRWDTATATEILPACPGITYPSSGGSATWTQTVLDRFDGLDYLGDDGSASWPVGWSETGDDGKPTGGKISLTTGPTQYELTLEASASTVGRTVQRTADLRNPADANLATTATLTLKATSVLDGDALVAAEISPDGTTWTTLASWDASSASTRTAYSYPLPTEAISKSTQIRFRIVSAGSGGAMVSFDDVQIEYGGGTPSVPDQVAPIFRPEMQNDPRWGVIPLIDYWSNPTAAPVEGFWGFYGYSAYTTNSKVQAFDAWVFDPALVVDDPKTETFTFGISPEPFARLLS